MKKCPKCKHVFDDTWKVCITCNAELLNELSVKGCPDPEKLTPKYLLIIIGIIGGIFLMFFMVFAIGGLISQFVYAPEYYAKKARAEFVANIDKHSWPEISQFIRDGDEYVLNHPRDDVARGLLKEAKERSKWPDM